MEVEAWYPVVWPEESFPSVEYGLDWLISATIFYVTLGVYFNRLDAIYLKDFLTIVISFKFLERWLHVSASTYLPQREMSNE